MLGLPDIFTGDRLTEKFVELCNDVGAMVEVRDIEVCHRLFKKESNNKQRKELFHVNIVSHDKYLDGFHNLLSVIKFRFQVIGICEHKMKKGSCLNDSLLGYTLETKSTNYS